MRSSIGSSTMPTALRSRGNLCENAKANWRRTRPRSPFTNHPPLTTASLRSEGWQRWVGISGSIQPELVATLAGIRKRAPRDTAVNYLNKVKALYDKRNECIHSLGIEVAENETHLYKRKK